MRKNVSVAVLLLLLAGSTAYGQSSVGALGGASDAGQRMFDHGFQQAADTVRDAASVEVQPEFPGGQAAMFRFLQEQVRYPQEEQDAGVQGKVYVRFIVEKNGAVGRVEVLRSASPGLDAEAVRAVKAMPRWSSGLQDGEPVRVRFVLPISFKLPSKEAPTQVPRGEGGPLAQPPEHGFPRP